MVGVKIVANDYYTASGEPRKQGIDDELLRREFRRVESGFDKIIISDPVSISDTDELAEGSSNLYFTYARVRDTVLTGISTATNAVIAATDSVLVALGKLQAQVSDVSAIGATYPLAKTNPATPAFTKTGAGTISLKAGTYVNVAGVIIPFLTDTAVVMPTLVAGTDYAIYVCTDGTVRADSSISYPTGYTVDNSLKIGGFHYGLVAAGTTVAGGGFATTGSGMIWTQSQVDDIAGINAYSMWDLKFRPLCDPRGMALVGGSTWVDIYLCNTDTDANGTSKAGSNIASGTVLPKRPAAFAASTASYATLNWWEANELARAHKKRLILASEFYEAAFGVTESQSIGGAASTYPATQRNAGYTSKYGIEQASGHHYTWGADSAGSASAWVANGERGQSYNNSVYRVLLGGVRVDTSFSGSRCSSWLRVASYSVWGIGLRAACDHHS